MKCFSNVFINIRIQAVSSHMQQVDDNSSQSKIITEETVNEKPRQYIKILGHLNYVFCVCFDRTGQFIFTVTFFLVISISETVQKIKMKTNLLGYFNFLLNHFLER